MISPPVSVADAHYVTQQTAEDPPDKDTDTADLGEVVMAPLGFVADARSGDKGGNANVGVWVESSEAWRWLRTAITTEELKRLLPEISELRVDRFELPNLKALNFVIHGLLDGGATEARRFDKQAKALGEWLRARHVQVPEAILRRTS